jgi:response regulator RpfG family c-di-GMP phosphodiesterase
MSTDMSLKYSHTILLVDDEESIRKSLHRLFRKEGYEILSAGSGTEALDVLRHSGTEVSMIISDQRMPTMNGSEFLEQSIAVMPNAMRYLLTGYSDFGAVIDAVNKGKINRYIAKPWNDSELLSLVRSDLAIVELRLENKRLVELTEQQNAELILLNKDLEKKVNERTWALQYQNKKLQDLNAVFEKSVHDTIRLLTSLVQASNSRLGQYIESIAQLACEIATMLGLEVAEKNQIEIAARVQDIGLIGIGDQLLQKDKKAMSPQEFELFSQHPLIAALSLSSIRGFKEVNELVLYHHECCDGSGFPHGVKEDQIPFGAKILCVASEYQAVAHLWPDNVQSLRAFARRYLDGPVLGAIDIDDTTMRLQIAEQVIRSGSGSRFDAEVVKGFVKVIERIRPRPKKRHVGPWELEPGMVLLQDLRMKGGRLLLTRNTVLNEHTIEILRGIGERELIDGGIHVSEPGVDELT